MKTPVHPLPPNYAAFKEMQVRPQGRGCFSVYANTAALRIVPPFFSCIWVGMRIYIPESFPLQNTALKSIKGS